jgi:hypothetical protein
VAGTDWEVLAAGHSVTSGTLRVQLSDVGADNYVIADAIRVERVDSLPGGMPGIPADQQGGEGEADDPPRGDAAPWFRTASQVSPRVTDQALLAFLQNVPEIPF